MSDQLFLFNLIDGLPGGHVAVAPVAIAPVAPIAAVAPAPKPSPPKLKPKPPAEPYKPAVMDMVLILPFTDQWGNERGRFLNTPGVVLGFNPAGMVLVDVGTPGSLYAASPWRLVKMDD